MTLILGAPRKPGCRLPLTIFAYNLARIRLSWSVTNTPEALPCYLSVAHRLILAERAARRESEERAGLLLKH